ncbi:MAG: cadmium-translocating P-type ATPase [Anaerolineae bacterium]|nr:cadmium-translocating P-type ATPase [Anaerolineae bacterium]
MERTLELDLPILLPNVQDLQDQCIARLQTALAGKRGIANAHIETDRTPAQLCVHYDADLVSLNDVEQIAKRAGAEIVKRYHHELIPIEGMDCSDCARVIEHSVGRMDGVMNVTVNYPAQRMRVEYDSQKINRGAIDKRLRGLGYTIPAEGLKNFYQENREIIFSLTAGALVLIGWVGETFFGLPTLAATVLFVGAYFFGGLDISRHAIHALRERHFDTDLLMVTAAIGAALIGNFFEGALLLFLFSLGHALEERALDRARAAVRALADLAPKTALVKRDGKEIELPVEELLLEDVVIVRPGVRVPVDGIVVTGASAVNQAPVTGESVPVEKEPGAQVFAGSVNGEGALDVRVTRLAQDSTLARVMKLVEEAQTQKSPTQQTVEKFERVFVPAVLGVTALVIVVPPFLGVPFQESFLRAMTLLVAASPCALALGTPASILAGVAQAARNGVLVKGGVHLENLGRLKAIAFDKTGTITHGRPEVTDILVFDGKMSQDELLRLTASAESRSAHPLAQAVVRAAQNKKLALPEASDVESITGKGLQAKVEGRALLIGNFKLLQENNISMSDAAAKQIEALQVSGKTIILVAAERRLIGALGVADVLRPEAKETMRELRARGIEHTIMLTGDNQRVADAIAKTVGLTDVRADLLPEDKLTVIRELIQEYEQVGMVGDGVNDAPALANATVGIAMGGAGTDVALETADVALMGDDLSKLPFAVGLGRATRRIILQNLVISLGVIAFLIITSLTGIVSLGIAIVFHEGSTLVVVGNALRLLGYRDGG